MKIKKILNKLSFFVVILLLSVAFFSGCLQEDPNDTEEFTKLIIGAVPGQDAQRVLDMYEPLAEYLARVLDVEYELYLGTDYTATIEAMRAGKVDLAWYGPLSYVLAAEIGDAEAFVAGHHEDLGIFYESYIITHVESGINNISDLKGKSFAFVDPASTGGYLIPRMHMVEEGIDPDKDLADVAFLGGHDACAIAVQNQHVDAATIVKHQYEYAVERGEISEKDIKIIHVSDPFPGGPLAWRKSLPEDIKEKIRDAMLNMPEEEYENMKNLLGNIIYFEEVDDSVWDPIRKSAEFLDLEALI